MPTVIDAHCHVGKGMMNSQTPESLLEQMDRLGISQSVIVPWDQAVAVDNESGNDYVLSLADRYPDRLIPFCTVNPWYGRRAVDELKRAVGRGAKGLKINPVYQGYQLTDPILYPVIEAAVELNIPIYVPTGIPVMSMPLQLKHLACEFPEGVFIQGHFGATDFWIDAIPSVENCPNIYVDTSYNIVSLIEKAVKTLGAERVIFSSDSPYLSLQSELEKIDMLAVSEREKELIVSGNIQRLLGVG